jgi:hypothetical protein
MKIDIEKVNNLNKIQNEGKFHPYTCGNDGDEKHILYESAKYVAPLQRTIGLI